MGLCGNNSGIYNYIVLGFANCLLVVCVCGSADCFRNMVYALLLSMTQNIFHCERNGEFEDICF